MNELSVVFAKFALKILTDPLYGIAFMDERKSNQENIEFIVSLCQRVVEGKEVPKQTWLDAIIKCDKGHTDPRRSASYIAGIFCARYLSAAMSSAAAAISYAASAYHERNFRHNPQAGNNHYKWQEETLLKIIKEEC